MLSSLTVFRSACFVLALILSLASVRTLAACDNIVAVSRGWAEYMVLDPATLAMLQVGDLRWLGIQSVNFAARGSTFERSVLNSYDYLRVNSEEPVIEGLPGSRTSSAFTLLFLENMGEEINSQDEVPIMDSGSIMLESYERIQWANWIQDNTLIREIYDRDQHYVAGQELLDTDFNVLRRWEPQVGFNLQYPSCAIGDMLYFAGWREEVHVFDGQGGTIYELEELQNDGLRLVTPHTKNCKSLAFRDTADDDPMFGAVMVDVVTGTLGPEFEVHKFGEYILYDGGSRLLQQKQEGRVVVENTRRYGSSGDHTNQFSLIDTTTGEVLLERDLQTGTGELSREILCDNETPRALVQEGNTMHLINPNTLEITASKAMPESWDGGFLIFE